MINSIVVIYLEEIFSANFSHWLPGFLTLMSIAFIYPETDKKRKRAEQVMYIKKKKAIHDFIRSVLAHSMQPTCDVSCLHA
jgi:hypothetical protein